MTDTNNEQMSITLNGKETVDIVNRLCSATGMTPPCLVALLIRKYGKDLESWVGNSSASEENNPNYNNKPTVELPTDPGAHLPPVEL